MVSIQLYFWYLLRFPEHWLAYLILLFFYFLYLYLNKYKSYIPEWICHVWKSMLNDFVGDVAALFFPISIILLLFSTQKLSNFKPTFMLNVNHLSFSYGESLF